MSDTHKDRRDTRPVFKPKVYISSSAQRQSAQQEIEEELNLWEAQNEDGTLSMGMFEDVLLQTWGTPFLPPGGRET